MQTVNISVSASLCYYEVGRLLSRLQQQTLVDISVDMQEE